ncbi:hypothetical protein N7462_001231 [Penicillium macrosclerotiorum]|uniref:uncharacterized protein n=1 Tax=Penicillium macrosclerotiorum TaxID=303699 RepID=UPI002549660E|nr:uncharacterized protein N7462_001231 [Penicillium macrosclerotiorum]KAJ5691808.1 hypothetical protein N7462_001231 [Penicillium macrosclerotiorum]
MVSFWPWKGEDNSPASFEKTLSALSTKISQATTRLDQQRQTARRFKALWTLYSTLAYLFYSIVSALVLGWDNWGLKEYAAIVGGPVLIYGVRTIAARLFDYRVARSQRQLDDLHKQRNETIEKLKTATRYNSTQQLLDKYGGETPKASSGPKNVSGGLQESTPSQKQQQPVTRTGLPPPPTANIRRPSGQVPAGPGNPPSPPPFDIPVQQQTVPNTPPSAHTAPHPPADEPGFAPNAFSSPGQYIEQPHWYDRLLDVLLGEDEMQPRNRMAMICTSCRLVNGQAPPGIKTPEELGQWRCGSCGAWNGAESETAKILSSLRQATAPTEGSWESVSRADVDPAAEDATSEHMMLATSGEAEQDILHDSDESENARSDHSGPDEAKPEPVRRSKRGKKE